MSCKQLLTEELSTDDNVISMIDDRNSQLILDLINSCLQKSYLDSSYSCSFWKVEEIYVISNEKLEANYREKSEELKTSHENLYPTTLFTCYRTDNCLKDIAVHGLRTKSTGFNILVSELRHVTRGKEGIGLVEKWKHCGSMCMCSRIARIDCCDKGRNNRCPVLDYDCHISSIRPSLNDCLLVQAVRAQIYFYDVNEKGAFFNHPRQCLPLACVVYTKSQSNEEAASLPVKHFDVRRQPISAEAVVDLTGSDETIPLLDEARGAIIYNRLRRHLRKATSSEAIYSLSNYFPKPVDDRNLYPLVSSSTDKGALWRRVVVQSSLQPTMADTASTLAVTTNGAGEESAALVTGQENPVLSLRATMSQFCVKKTQKNPSGAPLVVVSSAASGALGIVIAPNVVVSTGVATSQPNTTISSWSSGRSIAMNTMSLATVVPDVQVVMTNALPRALAPRGAVGRTIVPRTLTLKGVGTAAQTNSYASFNSTAAHGTTAGLAPIPQCPRLVRYLPRILRPPAGLGGVRLLPNSNASTVAVSLPVTSSKTMSCAMPKLHASNRVPLVTRSTTMASLPSSTFNGGSNVRPNTRPSLITRATRPQSVTMMIARSSSISGGSNIRPTATFDAMQLMPQWQAVSPPLSLQTIPLYTDCSEVNLLGPQAQLLRPAASQQVSLAANQQVSLAASQQVSFAGTSRDPAGMISLRSPQPFILHIPSNLAQFTVTRSADQLRVSADTAAAAAALEENLFFGGRGVEEITIEDEGLVINNVRPIVIMPDGTCDEDEDQNCSLADGVQGNAEAYSIDKVSDCNLGILKMEENSTHSKVRNQKSHTIILDADLPVNDAESNSNIMTESTVLRLVDQEVDEDGYLLDKQLRISDVVSLQTESDKSDSSLVHRRLLGELWMENADQFDSVGPVETSLSSSNCKIISLASVEVKNAPQASASLSLNQAEIVRVESKTAISASDKLVQSPAEDSLVHSMTSVGLKTSSSLMQDDAQASENRVGETTAEKEVATTDSRIKCGLQKQQKASLQRLLLHPLPEKQKSNRNAQLSTGVCLPAYKEGMSTTKEVSEAKQRQPIPVFTVCADGSVSIRLEDEPERADEDKQNASHCDVRIELLRDVEEKDTLMKALAKVLGNVHVMDLRNSSDEIVYCSQNKNTEEITSSSLNLKRNNLTKMNGVEERTRLEQDSFISHKPAKPNRDNEANDTNILIESVHSMCLDKFDEIGVSSGDAKSVDPLPSKKLTAQNDEEESLRGLDKLVINTSRANSVCSMNTSDFEESNVEGDEPLQICEDETENFSVAAPQSCHGFQQQSTCSEVTCSTESSNANLNVDVSGIENFRQLITKSQCTSNSAFEQLPVSAKNKSDISALNGRPPLDSTDESESSNMLSKKVLFQSENSGLNEELSSKELHCVGIYESEQARVCEEPCLDSDLESEISRLQTETPLSSVNMSEPSRVVEQVPVLLDSTLETCRMNEQQPKDIVNKSELTCSMNKKQHQGLETESETCGINNKQSLPLANEPGLLGLNLELPVDSANSSDSFKKSKEVHFHVTNECDVGLAKESKTCRMHEEQHVDMPIESESCKTHEEQRLDLENESDSCRMHEELQSKSCRTYDVQQLDFASESELCKTSEEQHLDIASESDTCRMHEEQTLDLANGSELVKSSDEQHLNLANGSELVKSSYEQHLDLANGPELVKSSDEQHLDLANESETCRMHEDEHLDLASELGLCITHEEQPLDLTIESNTCRLHEEQQSESCRAHEEQHLDLANESETLGIDRQLSSETANEVDSLCEKPLLKLAKKLPNTRTLKESLLNLAIKWRESGVNENFRMANAANSVRSNLKTSESLKLSCFDSIASEAILPISPACASDEISFANVTETISSAYVTEATSSACKTRAISPTYEIEAISPTYETEAISPNKVETEAISPTYESEAISSNKTETDPISPAYVTEAISPAYIMEPISPAFVMEQIFPPPSDTYRPVTENVSPPSYAEDAPVAQAVTGVHESNSAITSDGYLRSSACQQSGSETNLSCHYSSKNDTRDTGVTAFHLANNYFIESVKKSAELDSETSHQTSPTSEAKAVARKKKVLSLEEYKMSKLNRSMREVENSSNLKAPETQVQTMSLNTSSLNLDTRLLDDQEGSCYSRSVAFRSTRAEERNNDQLKILNLDLKSSEKVMEKTNSALIDSIRQRDPRLQGKDCAFKDAESTWNYAPGEMERGKELDDARVHMMAEEQFTDLDKDVADVDELVDLDEDFVTVDQLVDYDEDVYVDTQQQLSIHLAVEEKEESFSKNMDKLLNDTSMEDGNEMAREQKDRPKIELITGDEELVCGVKWGCQFIDEESGSDGREPGEIEDESCTSTTEVDTEQVANEQVANEQVVEVLDDWDECGDFVIVGSSLDILSDDDKESGEVTSDSSDEFGDLVVDDGADGEDEYDCNLHQRQSIDGETDQEDVWHQLDDALSVGGNCEHEDTRQRKGSNKKVQKKSPIIIRLKDAKRLAQDDRGHGNDGFLENAGTGLKWNCEGTSVSEKCHSHHSHHRKHKSSTKKSCRLYRTRRNNPADICEFPPKKHLRISDDKHDYHRLNEDQSPLYRRDIYQGASGELSREHKGCVPIDIEIIKVLRNVDETSAERSVFGSADSFVTLLMKEFQHLPEESQRYYSKCIRETLQVDKEFVTSEHIYGSMAELLTEEQRQHIQRTNISPIVALEIHLEDILKKVKLELGNNKSDSDSDLSHHNLLVLTKEMLYDQLNDLKCYQKSRSVFVLPDEFRLPRETGKYISVDGSLLFIYKSTLSVKICCRLYCYRTEIEEMEDELNESLGDAGGLTEDICRKLSVLYLKRRHCLHNIGCSADQLDPLKKKFSRNLSWFRRMRDVLQSRDHSQDGQEMALINCLNQRIEKLQEYIKAITSLKNVRGTWCPDSSERTEL